MCGYVAAVAWTTHFCCRWPPTRQIVELLLEVAGKVESERAKMEATSDVQQLVAEGYKVGVPSMVSVRRPDLTCAGAG